MTTPLPSGDIERLVERLRVPIPWAEVNLAAEARYDAERAEAATALSDLTRRCEALERERLETREACSLVRRQNYFDVPTPVLVEAQIGFVVWRTLEDLKAMATGLQPEIDAALNRYRARSTLTGGRE